MAEYELPLYGCLTGLILPVENFELAPGLTLRRAYFDIFDAPMMAFAPPEKPHSHHPAPWVAVRGGFTFQSRVELAIHDLGPLDGFSPSLAAWLIAALFRLRIEAPVRIPALAKVPLKQLSNTNGTADAFESAPYHIGLFRGMHATLTLEDLQWAATTLPIAARFCHDDRFMRAFSIFDESVWSLRVELGTILIWTAIEILFDKSAEQSKTKAICSALSEFVASSPEDRDRAYNMIRDLYEKRGRIVHVGQKIDPNDFGQSFAFARAAFMNVLNRNKLPPARITPLH